MNEGLWHGAVAVLWCAIAAWLGLTPGRMWYTPGVVLVIAAVGGLHLWQAWWIWRRRRGAADG